MSLTSPRRLLLLGLLGMAWFPTVFLLPATAQAGTIPPRGRHLAQVMDRLGVENRWLPGRAIDWRSGEGDPTAAPLRSHCSSFAAAACAAVGIYLLRPPDHPEWLLANAQCRWLETEGPGRGWKALLDGTEAQRRANRGDLVIVCYQNPDHDEAGHIAVVRPGSKSRRRLALEGPDVIQAGMVNYRRTSVRNAFAYHPLAWEQGKIRYFGHRTR